MIFYRLNVEPAEWDAEGEDHDEWFTSLAAAVAQRKSYIKLDPTLDRHPTGRDFRIEKVWFTDKLSEKQLILRVLNRRAYIVRTQKVVDWYQPEK